MYRIDVQWSPACELLSSLRAYTVRSEIKVLERGRDWRRRVAERLPPMLPRQLDESEIALFLDLLDLLVWQCPHQDSAHGFIHWLAGLSAGDLAAALLSHCSPAELSAAKRLSASHDRVVALLAAWDEAYGRAIEPALLQGLSDAAGAARAAVSSADPPTLLEELTHGLCIAPDEAPELIVVGPQYHCVPLNVICAFDDLVVIRYAVDPIAAPPGEPPPGLLRLTRALADDSRLRILAILARDGPVNLTQVAEEAGLAVSTAHHHLVMLRAAGMVRVHHALRSTPTYSLRPAAIESLKTHLDAFLGYR